MIVLGNVLQTSLLTIILLLCYCWATEHESAAPPKIGPLNPAMHEVGGLSFGPVKSGRGDHILAKNDSIQLGWKPMVV